MPKQKKPPSKPRRGDKSSINGVGVIYGRYSSHAQKDISIEQQVEKCRELSAEFGIEISEVYADRAISGRTDRRPEFQRMLKDAAKGKFCYVLAWKSNRIGRNMMEALINEARLNELGVRLLYVEEDFDDSAAGRFAARSMMNVNQFYSENMSEDIKRGMENNAMNCKVTNGTIPFGYRRGDDLRYELDPPKDGVVREIFSRVLCGDRLIDIARDLNRRGIRTSKGAEWNRGSFHSILSNERYTGVYIYDGIRVEGGIPQIIDKGTFFRVQEVLKVKKNPVGRHRKTGSYALTGKLFCGHCKSPMIGVSGTSKQKNLHYYYVCKGKRAKNGCLKENVRRDWIEEQVATAIKNHVLNDDVAEWIADSVIAFAKDYKEGTLIDSLSARLEANKIATKNLLAAIEKGIITETTKNRLLELEKEQSVLDSKLKEEYASLLNFSRDDVISAIRLYQTGDVTDKSFQGKLFDVFLRAVYVYDDKLKIVFSVTGETNAVEVPISASDTENSNGDLCSYKRPDGSPKEGQTSLMSVLLFLS